MLSTVKGATMESFFVEIIIRSDKTPVYTKSDYDRRPAQDELLRDLKSYMVFGSDDKIVLNVPTTWVGFKDGTIIAMRKKFGENMYTALAYFSPDNNEYESVTDFEGKLIDAHDTIFNGQMMRKFVKKKIQIVNVIDKERDVFTIKRYAIDLKYTDPVLKVMDLYSDASCGGISSKEFLK